MPQREIDSLSSDGAQLVASLLARIDRLMAQIAARDERIDELLAQVKALNARIAELESKRGGPPKTPDNSSLPPSRGQKANAELPAVQRRRKGRAGGAAQPAGKPGAASGQAAAQGSARRRAQAGRKSRRDATLLRGALCLWRRAQRSRPETREGDETNGDSAVRPDPEGHRLVLAHFP